MSLQVQQVSVKLPVAERGTGGDDAVIRAFHRWIQDAALDGELLIDVTDYSHVPQGPGVLLIAHDAQYGLDESGGELGLQYRKKRDEPGPLEDKLRDALTRLRAAAALLERDPGLRFDAARLEIQVHNRLLAPNTDETFAAARPAIEAVLGDDVQLERAGTERELFRVLVRGVAT